MDEEQMIKPKSNFEVVEFSKDYLNDVCRISDEMLGSNYLTEKDFEKVGTKGTNVKCLVLKHVKTNEIAGFCLYYLLGDKQTEKIVEEELNEELKQNKFGYIKTVTVAKKYQFTKLRTKLLEEVVARLQKKNIEKLFTTIWAKPTSSADLRLFKKFNFFSFKKIKDYWYESSLKEKYVCPICGNPCYCSCIIMTNF